MEKVVFLLSNKNLIIPKCPSGVPIRCPWPVVRRVVNKNLKKKKSLEFSSLKKN